MRTTTRSPGRADKIVMSAERLPRSSEATSKTPRALGEASLDEQGRIAEVADEMRDPFLGPFRARLVVDDDDGLAGGSQVFEHPPADPTQTAQDDVIHAEVVVSGQLSSAQQDAESHWRASVRKPDVDAENTSASASTLANSVTDFGADP